MVCVDVLEHRERCELALHGPGSNDADLLGEVDKSLVDAFGAAQTREGLREFRGGAKRSLSFAIVAKAGGFEDARQTEFAGCGYEIFQGMDGAERGYRESVVAEEPFFPQPLLRDVQHPTRRPYRHHFRTGVAGGAGDVFEFERHHIHGPGKGPNWVQVFVRCDKGAIGDRRRRRICFRAEDVDSVTQSACGNGEHAAQLPTAQHAESGPWWNDASVM